MPRIEQSLLINASVDRAYAIARDVEAFPNYMDDLQSIKVVERSEDGNRTITEWVGLVRQFKMTLKWTQEDIWNPETHRDDFKALKGDVDSMSGFWQFTEENGQTRFESLVDYEINVPLVGALVKQLIRKLMEQNLEAQMLAIKHQAEQG
jgi:ribosome-associated toxin RatA of RatAB toxin-antitoxin module